MYAQTLLLGFAATALALPTRSDRLANRLRRRGFLDTHYSKPLELISVPGAPKPESNSTGSSAKVAYSSNWSGAVYESSPSGSFTGVSATITIPTPKKPSGGSSSTTYAASAWVGIDGDTCTSAIWQTGVDFEVRGTTVSYDAWYEWYPDYASDFSGITFSAGDSVTMSVTATSKTSGTAVITNNSKAQSVSKTVTGSSESLCETNAEWIVEDFEECTSSSSSSCSLVPLANWGTVTFSSATATTTTETIGPSGATIIDIEQNGKVLTSVSVSSTSVTDTYTG